MANHYSNPTENAAIGAVDKELNRLYKKAQHLKRLRETGRLSPQEIARARREFTGLSRRFLREALGE